MNTPTLNPTSADYVYAAGFFDGEGYVGIVGKNSEKLRMSVVGTDPRPLLRFRALFGGSISAVAMQKYGANNRNRFTWEVSGRTAAGVLSGMLPHLLVKAEQAQVALEFMATFGAGNVKVGDPKHTIRKRCDEQLRALKAREFDLDFCKD